MNRMMAKYLSMASRCFGLLLLLALGACSSVRVEQLRGDLTQMPLEKGYSWLVPPLAGSQTDARGLLLDRVVRREVDRQLAARGFRRVDGTRANFIIDYRVNVASELVLADKPPPAYWNSQWDTNADTDFLPALDSYRQRGSLFLGFLAPANKQVRWAAKASVVVGKRASDSEVEEFLQRAVDKLLADLPVQL